MDWGLFAHFQEMEGYIVWFQSLGTELWTTLNIKGGKCFFPLFIYLGSRKDYIDAIIFLFDDS